MRQLFLLAFFVCSAANAQALKPASRNEYAKIKALLWQAKEKNLAITDNRALRIGADEDLTARLDVEYARLSAESAETHRRALWLTIKAYGILPFNGKNEPILPTGVSVYRSPQNGKSITWVPIFEEDVPHNMQNEVGRIVASAPLTPDIGNFSSDGVSRLLPGAFTSPAELASTIIHEKIHFEQAVSPGRGDVLTPAEREVEAYQAQQKLLEDGTLGFTEDEKKREKLYLAKNLKKRKLQAAAERAKVDNAPKLPIDEFSVASLSGDEIKRLVAQARVQVKIAQRDHDERLKIALGDITARSCANPGSVSQDELNSLTQPYKPNFYAGTNPSGVGDCASVYLYLAQGGRNAGSLGRQSVPVKPVDAGPSRPLHPVPATPPNPANIRTSFDSALPGLKDLAERACRSDQQVPIDKQFTAPKYPFAFSEERDNRRTAELASGLGDCENRLFSRLIQVVRNGEGNLISEQWVQETAAQYRNEQQAPPQGTAPPQGGQTPPDYDPCRANGNKHCP